MKKFLAVAILAAFVLSACSATPERRAFKEGWKDSVASSKIKWKMARDKQVRATKIHVKTWRGQVTLTGRTTKPEEKVRAEEIARQAKNVKDVRNYIDVLETAVPESTANVANKQEASTDTGSKFAETNKKGVKPAVVEDDLKNEPVHKDSVSNVIKKDLAMTKDAEDRDDVTSQAEEELKELKARKR